ncbi:T9SS type A sorting domain-containing protein [bacterium]|nr:T9SS type A sorting domain-containing protein [bacterium]
MKIILRIIIGILMVLPTAVWADIVKELSLHYDTEDFTITRNGDMVKVDVTPMLSLDNVYDSNRPYLPEMVYNLAQLGGREFYETELTVTTSEPILLAENVTVATMNPFEANPDKDWEQYFFNDKTPQEKVKLTVFSNLWGVWVRPILYDLATGNLYLTTDIDIKVTFRRKIDSKEIHNEIRNSPNTKSENSVAPQLIIGIHESLDLIPDGFAPSDSADYMIITSKTLKSAYDSLAHWKFQKGLSVKVITIEEITNTYDGSTLQEKIKNCIRQHYLYRLNYVLLGGGTNIIPSPLCYGEVNIPGTGNSIPTDMYYSCLYGQIDWDSNKNKIYGEIDDNCTLAPALVVTRVPLDTSKEVMVFVNKVINYEKGLPNSQDYPLPSEPSILLTGAEMNGKTKDGRSDAQVNGDFIYDVGIKSYWTNTVDKKFDTSKPGFKLDADFISDQLEAGYAFIDVQSHGKRAGWLFPNGYEFTNLTARKNIQNPAYTVITSNACNVNAFDKSSRANPCLSQFLIGDAKNGVIAFYGSSREGLGAEKPDQYGYSQLYESAFYGMLLKDPLENKSFGRITALSKERYRLRADSILAYRWLHFGFNPIGDPEMPIRVTEAASFDSVPISIINKGIMTRITVGTNNCMISLTGTKKGKPFKAVTRRGSILQLMEALPDDPVLVISKQNYKPLIVEGKEKILSLGKTQNRIIGPSDVTVANNIVCIAIDSNENSNIQLTLYDLMGNVRIQGNPMTGNNEEIDISYLEKGVYILSIQIDGQPIESHKILKR